ncbi:isocitrate lyase/phosphoenolpyruvate mutase family protein [Nocardiopsis rhodophaea]|uniref:isocitrate lyase/phosphoenolpyruvate mutase family protein n=1 Tax=Nocardiopsis rhodophaea TaxID=280238 RepID=UPI0031D6E4BD
MTKSASLRECLSHPRIAKAIGAHSAISAKLAEESGFDVVWASGLEISALHAVPDANILSMSECLQVAASMAAATRLPVLADCDSGFGNVNNVQHMVRSYESAGIAGVCIEDKQFPKLNSFADGSQELASIADFAARMSAATEARQDDDFVIVARLEAFISGLGLEEALSRAAAYEEAGADALLIHSKKEDAAEVSAFRRGYSGRLPVIAVPTTYHRVSASELEEQGFAMAIYANHALRSSIKAMRETLARISRDGSTHLLEADLAPVKEIFDLQGLPRMLESQERHENRGKEIAEV